MCGLGLLPVENEDNLDIYLASFINHCIYLFPWWPLEALSRAQRNLATSLMSFQFECIGNSQTDDEIVIAGSLKEFGRLINAIEDERDRMVLLLVRFLFL